MGILCLGDPVACGATMGINNRRCRVVRTDLSVCGQRQLAAKQSGCQLNLSLLVVLGNIDDGRWTRAGGIGGRGWTRNINLIVNSIHKLFVMTGWSDCEGKCEYPRFGAAVQGIITYGHSRKPIQAGRREAEEWRYTAVRLHPRKCRQTYRTPHYEHGKLSRICIVRGSEHTSEPRRALGRTEHPAYRTRRRVAKHACN